MATAPLQIETLTNRNLEVVRTGVINSAVGVAGTITTATLTHNLGFIPILICYMDLTTVQRPLPAMVSNTLGTTYIQDFARLSAQVSSTILTIYTETATGQAATSYPIRYYLLKETAK